MNLTMLFQFLLVGTLAFASLIALVLLTNALFPNLITRARANAERMPLRSFVVGVVNFIFFGLIVLALLSGAAEIAKLFGLVIGTLLLGFLALGLTAMARLVGERVAANQGNIRQLIVGTALVEFAALVPLVGWFLVPLLVLMTGLGAVIIAMIWRK